MATASAGDVERIAGRDGRGDHLIACSAWGQRQPGILVLSHLDTVHPIGFIERLPFRVEGDVAYGPGIYDMKGGAYLAYHGVRAALRDGRATPLGITHLHRLGRGDRQPDLARAHRGRGAKAKYVLVTEPARDGGKIVTGRKGVGAVRGVRARACPRMPARGPRRTQRHPRARQCDPRARGDDHDRRAASPSMSA